MNRPFTIHARTYFCASIVFIVSVALCAQDSSKTTATQTQITNVRVGAVSIALPSPGNDLVEPGPDYRVIFEMLAPVNNRLVAAFVPLDKMDLIHKGNAPQMDRYALVQVARKMEFAEADSAAFQRVADVLGKQFGEISQSTSKGQEDINHSLKSMGSSDSVTIDKPVSLGIFFSMKDAIGVGSITPYNVNGVVTRTAGCLVFLHVRGRILSVFTYATYKDEGTVTWVKTTSEQWVSAILKANE